ncbi:efflux RND transporter periplasmic adaptor subunit [Reichenbachiella ulvae]|uniref:Efflux RND transporter periplasmic adaptor subunit n=1 Tax=Reichenbachiella ulvae TaxID=2980104 RepID=A0ABT3CR78_9BACT|nr:efflux RND transporter periplasmic adaptor subunit [Reichenbachiella ulvae]MCV9386004.1 efflux RND transporter periplasmic adaptor subunit [Reichenbachiella ulvae]
MKSKRNLIIVAVVLIAIIPTWLLTSSGEAESVLISEAVKGDLAIQVTTTGELEAQKSVKIMGPGDGMQAAGIWDTRMDHIVEEGTVVKKGDYVARLDGSSLEDKIKNSMDELTRVESEYTSTKLDTTLTMREQRDKLLNMKFVVEEKKIKVEQSAFEPPATIKQAKMELEKAERELQQATENYKIKKAQMDAKMTVAAANRETIRRKVQMMNDLKSSFTIFAPEDGMVIYSKDWRGAKIKSGDQIMSYRPIVATLPDLSKMISRTYVNEVDIRNIKKGQSVKIGLDAFPDKELNGEVIKVANVGEQKPNSDSKVFEVSVLIHEYDSILRPSMTTSNQILIKSLEDCVYVPLEAIHSQGDSINYLIVSEGFGYKKKEVNVGDTNDQFAVITDGIKEGTKIALNESPKVADQPIDLLQ